MVVEFHMPETAHFALQGVYYVFAVITLLGPILESRVVTIQVQFPCSLFPMQSLCTVA